MIKRLFICGMIVVSLSACEDSGETISKKHSFVEAEVRGITSQCWGRYCNTQSVDVVAMSTDNDVLVFNNKCNGKPSAKIGDRVTILKTVTVKALSQGQQVERVNYAICY